MKNKNIDFKSRQLMRSCNKTYLATQFIPSKKSLIDNLDNANFIPYVTFLMVAFDYDGSPLLLLSELSEHTKNLEENNNASLLFYEEQKFEDFFPTFGKENYKNKKQFYEDPMSRPRLTVIGELHKIKSKYVKDRFISKHPISSLYANFGDMNIYKMFVKGGHLTGGFAKVNWFNRKDLIIKNFKNFEAQEFDIVNHMNDHHQSSINLFSEFLINGQHKKGDWKITGIDPEGFDIRLNNLTRRYFFEKQLEDSNELRKIFIKLHKKANEIMD